MKATARPDHIVDPRANRTRQRPAFGPGAFAPADPAQLVISDSRPAIVALGALQAMFDASPKVRRLQALQQRANSGAGADKTAQFQAQANGAQPGLTQPLQAQPSDQPQQRQLAQPGPQGKIIQRKSPLTSASLNVVGEEHPESNARRTPEKQYSNIFSGSSSYWTEAQFKVRSFSFVSDFLTDERPIADPFKDRLKQTVSKIELTNPWHHSAQSAPLNFVTYVGTNPGTLINRFTEGPKHYAVSLNTLIGNLANGGDGFELSDLQKAHFLNLRDDAAAVLRNVNRGIAMLGGDSESDQVTANALDVMFRSITALKNALGDDRDDDAVRITRSDAMHLAANARSAEKGVWKIGDGHVPDIQGEDRDYNLVTKDQVNRHYGHWVKMQGDAVSKADFEDGRESPHDEGYFIYLDHLLFNKKWESEGEGIFGAKLPGGIATMRDACRNGQHWAVFKIASNKRDNNIDKRSPLVRDLYEYLNDLGERMATQKLTLASAMIELKSWKI